MAPSDSFATPGPLARIATYWNVLVQAATWLTSLIAGFLLPPPVDSIQGGSGSLFKFAQFVMPVFVGLMVVPILTWRRRTDTNKWWAVGLMTLIGGIAAFSLYRGLTASWTEPYADQRVVIGSVFNEDVRDYLAEHPNTPNAELLQDFPGGPEKVWTKSSINCHINILSFLYIIFMPLFAMSIMSVTQAIYCAGRS
jgi:hypothetical protein